MEAARVAALRGHMVTLCDRNRQLGGALLLAQVLNPELPKFLRYMVRQVKTLPMEIRLERNVDADYVDKQKPDVVIVATGGTPPKIEIPGVDLPNVLTSHDILEAMVRAPKKGGIFNRTMWIFGSRALRRMQNPDKLRQALKLPFPFRKKVVIIGGDFSGCELADTLAELGKNVTILEESKRLGYDIGITTRWVALKRLSEFKVQMEKNAKVTEITRKGVKAMVEGKEKFYDAGTVALTLPLATDDTLASQIEAKGYKVYRVGDCSASGGRIMEAIAAGFKSGYEI